MIQIRDLNIRLPGFAVSDISLRVKAGEFFTLIGPTGSGKSLVLESLAGLAPKGSGQLQVNGQDVAGLPPEKRGISLVYQDHSLFPHMSVLDNVTYGQRYHGIDRKTGIDEAMLLLDRLGLARVVNRRPEKLSGGEKQRVSIARALACRPSVLLLDEPMSSLDPQFRAELRQSLKSLHRDTGLTILMVTHDFVDALTLSDQAAVIRDGRLEQTGNVTDIFRQPATPFAARFVGMVNVLPATFASGQCRFAGHTVTLDDQPKWGDGFVAFRPEDIMVRRSNDFPEDWCAMQGRIDRVDREGFHWTACIHCNDQTVTASVDHLLALDHARVNAEVYMGLPRSLLHLMPPEDYN